MLSDYLKLSKPVLCDQPNTGKLVLCDLPREHFNRVASQVCLEIQV